jgi:hypothetical protein
MTPRPRAVLLRATNINVLAFPGSAQAYARLVPRRQPNGPLNAKKVSFERLLRRFRPSDLAIASYRTRPTTAEDVAQLPQDARMPIAGG